MTPPEGPLEPPDSLHLQAAQGWLELGDHIEANEELENITPKLRTHPAVPALRWEIYATAKNWGAALNIAAALIQLKPDGPLGWVHRSYALHELKRTAEARDNLLRVLDKFPISATMRYNLACYECQLGDLERAKQWLEKAFKLGDAKKMKLAALDDPALEPLWRTGGQGGSGKGAERRPLLQFALLSAEASGWSIVRLRTWAWTSAETVSGLARRPFCDSSKTRNRSWVAVATSMNRPTMPVGNGQRGLGARFGSSLARRAGGSTTPAWRSGMIWKLRVPRIACSTQCRFDDPIDTWAPWVSDCAASPFLPLYGWESTLLGQCRKCPSSFLLLPNRCWCNQQISPAGRPLPSPCSWRTLRGIEPWTPLAAIKSAITERFSVRWKPKTLSAYES